MYIEEETCRKLDISLSELFCLLYVNYGEMDFNEQMNELIKKGYLYTDTTGLFPKVRLSQDGIMKVNDINTYSNPEIGAKKTQDRVSALVLKLQALYPEGKKDGTSLYWRGNKKDIERKLSQFFIRYQNYSDEELLDAVKRYVESVNGNYSFMRVLQYFIWKVSNQDGKQVCSSDLATFIENKGQSDLAVDWGVNIK